MRSIARILGVTVALFSLTAVCAFALDADSDEVIEKGRRVTYSAPRVQSAPRITAPRVSAPAVRRTVPSRRPTSVYTGSRQQRSVQPPRPGSIWAQTLTGPRWVGPAGIISVQNRTQTSAPNNRSSSPAQWTASDPRVYASGVPANMRVPGDTQRPEGSVSTGLTNRNFGVVNTGRPAVPYGGGSQVGLTSRAPVGSAGNSMQPSGANRLTISPQTGRISYDLSGRQGAGAAVAPPNSADVNRREAIDYVLSNHLAAAGYVGDRMMESAPRGAMRALSGRLLPAVAALPTARSLWENVQTANDPNADAAARSSAIGRAIIDSTALVWEGAAVGSGQPELGLVTPHLQYWGHMGVNAAGGWGTSAAGRMESTGVPAWYDRVTGRTPEPVMKPAK